MLESEEIKESEEESELFEHYKFRVDKGQTLIRIDKFLTAKIESISRNRIQMAADAGCILVNGKATKSSYKVKPLDEISIVMPYERRGIELLPEDIPIKIIYEDEYLLVVDKGAGMVVHPGHGNYSGTLVNAVLFHLHKTSINAEGDEVRGGLLVHRIDKDTSGLLVLAKTDYAHTKLAKQFFDRTVKRLYKALVWGNFDNNEGRIEGNIGRSLQDRLKMKVFKDGDHGKPAITNYRVLENLGYVSLVECKLETGRTHQIRVHMEYIGHPIFNDSRYGGDKILRGTTFSKYKQFVENCFYLIPGQALHAGYLGFIHPITGETMEFESPLPSGMFELINKWKNYKKNSE